MAVPSPSQAQQGPMVSELDGRARGADAQVNKVTVIGMRSRGVVNQPEDRHRLREGGVPFLLERDICKVENVDTVAWDFKWERRSYRIRPGESGLVPFPALVNALGDPRSVANEQTKFRTEDGQSGIIPTRHESIVTLFARYGVQNEDIHDVVAFAPKVIVRHMETEQVITFPSQNPECPPWPVPQHAAPGREPSGDRAAIIAVQEENQSLRAEMAEMRRLINDRLSPAAEPAAAIESPDPFASALAGDPTMGGATVDRGPSGTFE